VRISAFGDVIKVWVWVLGSLIIAFALTPVVYNAGKALSELSATKDFNGIVNKFAKWSGSAGLEDFFAFCWPIVAVMLLLPLIEWLRLGNNREGGNPWKFRLPHLAGRRSWGQRILPNQEVFLEGLTGFLMTFGCFVLIGYTMVKAGSVGWSADPQTWRDDLLYDIGRALGVAVIIEITFRCVVLGIFLRAMKITSAIAMAAAMFAGTRFLLVGFSNLEGIDEEMLSAIRLTGIVVGGGEPFVRLVVVFLPWFAFGCVLGWARWRTASVWLPIGLLMGWLLAARFFEKATQVMKIPDHIAGYFFASSVHTGIIPLGGILLIGMMVHFFTQNHGKEQEVED